MVYYGDGYYYDRAVSGYIQLGIWRYAGGWSRFTVEDVYVYQNVSSMGRQTVNWSFSGTYALGGGVTDFGATIETTDDTAAINYLAASWSASQSSGERSATANGGSAVALVSP